MANEHRQPLAVGVGVEMGRGVSQSGLVLHLTYVISSMSENLLAISNKMGKIIPTSLNIRLNEITKVKS